MRKVVR
jgi:hypothetical protein